MNRPLRHLMLAVALLGVVPAAWAAESYDNCTGFIDSLPATVSTQGTWCLRGHRFTSQLSGAAITIGADNITIDCNDFRLSGLGAGAATEAVGISAGASRHNAIVRNCRVQGFKRGVVLFGGGHVVEDNHLDLNTYNGIYVTGDSIARGNVVTDTGGRPNEVYADGIIAIGPGVQVIDNAIRGVSPAGNVGGDRAGRGIYLNTGLAQGNRVFGIVASGSHGAAGILLLGKTIARDNLVQAPSGTAGAGISGAGTDLSLCQDNTVQGFLSGIGTCQLAGANGVQ